MKNIFAKNLKIIGTMLLFLNSFSVNAIEDKYKLFCPMLEDYIERNGQFVLNRLTEVYDTSTPVINPRPFNPLGDIGIALTYDTSDFNQELFLKSFNRYGVVHMDVSPNKNYRESLVITRVQCDPDTALEYLKFKDVVANFCTCDINDSSCNQNTFTNLFKQTVGSRIAVTTNPAAEEGFVENRFDFVTTVDANGESFSESLKYTEVIENMYNEILELNLSKTCISSTTKIRGGQNVNNFCDIPSSGKIDIPNDSIDPALIELINEIGGSAACYLNLDFQMKVDSAITLTNVARFSGTAYTMGYGTVTCKRDNNGNPTLSLIPNNPGECLNTIGSIFDDSGSFNQKCRNVCIYIGNSSCPPMDVRWGTNNACYSTLGHNLNMRTTVLDNENKNMTGQISYRCVNGNWQINTSFTPSCVQQ